MRRLLITGFASLLAVALIAPAAQGATGVRSLTLEGEFAAIGPHGSPPQVRLSIDYLVKHKNGHERLIPNRVTHFDYLSVPVSCDPVYGNVFASGGSGFDPGIKITKKQFSTTFTTAGPAVHSTVQLVGQKMWRARTLYKSKTPKRAGRKFFVKRASGVSSIIDWDSPALGGSNCTSQGPVPWSAHQCRHVGSTGPVFVKVCRVGGGSL